MKAIKIIFGITVCILSSHFSKGQNTAYGFGASADDMGYGVTSDSLGNSYFTGKFAGTIDVDPGLGIFNLFSNNPNNPHDAYVIKLDSSGNLVWAVNTVTNGINTICGQRINVDNSGNVIVSGNISSNGTTDFDPGTGVSNVVVGGVSCFFIWKLDPSGNFISINTMTLSNNGAPNFTCSLFDSQQNLILGGTFGGTFDADPGSGVTTLTGNGSRDFFVLKFDPNLNLIFAFSIGGLDGERLTGICLDPSGDLLVCGTFAQTVDFDPGVGTFSLTVQSMLYGATGYIARYDALGNFIWVKAVSGNSTVEFQGVTEDSQGNIYISGEYNFTADFDPGTGVHYSTSLGLGDMFIEKLSNSGNFISLKTLRSNQGGIANFIKCDTADNIFISGVFHSSIDFDFGPGTFYLTSHGSVDVFVLKCDTNGNMIWSRSMGGIGADYVTGMNISRFGKVLLTGYFLGTAQFGTPASPVTLTSHGLADVFIEATRDISNLIKGRIYSDNNSSVSFDTGDRAIRGAVLQVGPNYYTDFVDTTTAFYKVYTDTGNYTITYTNPPQYYTLNNPSYQVSFANQIHGSDTANDFVLTPIPGITDLRIVVSNISDALPGGHPGYRITYKNIGTDTMSGSIMLHFDTLLNFTSASIAPQNIYTDSLGWSFTNLRPFQERNINVYFNVPTTVQPGDTLHFIADIDPLSNDSDLSNNHYPLDQIIVASHDPNFKETEEPIKLDTSYLVTPGYLTYTVHFQNTGTASAANIYLVDTIDPVNIQIPSLEILSASHTVSWEMTNGIVYFYFKSINLPAQQVNDSTSCGFVKFRVKTSANFGLGDTIHNEAYIYFDYNPPILTNATTNYIYQIPNNTSVSGQSSLENKYSAYPNPAKNTVTLKGFKNGNFAVLYDLLGNKVVASNSEIMDVSALSEGLYLLTVQDEKGNLLYCAKIIRQE